MYFSFVFLIFIFSSAKMSSSEGGSKIDILDTPESIKSKIKGAFCEEGSLENNGVLAFTRMVLFPLCRHGFQILRKVEHGGNSTYKTYQELETAFVNKKVHPKDLKDVTNIYMINE
jgi:tyrosyl-tRNA synthetase